MEAPTPVHGGYPDRPAAPAHRAWSGFASAAALLLLALVAAVGATMPFVAGMYDPFPPLAASAAFVLAALLSLVAAVLTFVRARRSETFASVTAAIAVALTWASMTNGWYYYSPFLVASTLFVILTLAHRAMARDELRHVSRDDTHGAGEGPTPARADRQKTATRRTHGRP